jgi:glycosyltransferase involved in cell wall biosynthesis
MEHTPKPIRVGFVVHIMQVAGVEVLVRETIHRLGNRIEPTIFCLDGIGSIGEQLLGEGVPVICLNRIPNGRDFGVSKRMAAAIRERDIEVVHAHQYSPFFYAAFAKPLTGFSFKLIQTEHGRKYPDVVSPLRRAVNRLVLDRLADSVNACCHFSGRALSQVDGFRGNRLEVIDNGIDLSRYSAHETRRELRTKLGLDPDRRYVACVARFHPIKDHAMLVRAFAIVAGKLPKADLLLAGEGPDRGMLEDLIRTLGIAERVKFLGVRKDVPDVMRASDLFAMTSLSEAASLTLMEAMASGCPVVVTDVGGNPELVRRGVDGLLVPRGDAGACAEAMFRVLSDPALAERMGAAGRERALERFDLNHTIGRYYSLYQKLSGRGHDL